MSTFRLGSAWFFFGADASAVDASDAFFFFASAGGIAIKDIKVSSGSAICNFRYMNFSW